MEQPCFENKACTFLFFRPSNQLCSAPVAAPVLFSIVSQKGTEALSIWKAPLSFCSQRNSQRNSHKTPTAGSPSCRQGKSTTSPWGKTSRHPGLGCGWFISRWVAWVVLQREAVQWDPVAHTVQGVGRWQCWMGAWVWFLQYLAPGRTNISIFHWEALS